jgi:small nuclear ribonucleoprotein (snRNP)-like protein
LFKVEALVKKRLMSVLPNYTRGINAVKRPKCVELKNGIRIEIGGVLKEILHFLKFLLKSAKSRGEEHI